MAPIWYSYDRHTYTVHTVFSSVNPAASARGLVRQTRYGLLLSLLTATALARPAHALDAEAIADTILPSPFIENESNDSTPVKPGFEQEENPTQTVSTPPEPAAEPEVDIDPRAAELDAMLTSIVEPEPKEATEAPADQATETRLETALSEKAEDTATTAVESPESNDKEGSWLGGFFNWDDAPAEDTAPEPTATPEPTAENVENNAPPAILTETALDAKPNADIATSLDALLDAPLPPKAEADVDTVDAVDTTDSETGKAAAETAPERPQTESNTQDRSTEDREGEATSAATLTLPWEETAREEDGEPEPEIPALATESETTDALADTEAEAPSPSSQTNEASEAIETSESSWFSGWFNDDDETSESMVEPSSADAPADDTVINSAVETAESITDEAVPAVLPDLSGEATETASEASIEGLADEPAAEAVESVDETQPESETPTEEEPAQPAKTETNASEEAEEALVEMPAIEAAEPKAATTPEVETSEGSWFSRWFAGEEEASESSPDASGNAEDTTDPSAEDSTQDAGQETKDNAPAPMPADKPAILRLNDVPTQGESLPYTLRTDSGTPWQGARLVRTENSSRNQPEISAETASQHGAALPDAETASLNAEDENAPHAALAASPSGLPEAVAHELPEATPEELPNDEPVNDMADAGRLAIREEIFEPNLTDAKPSLEDAADRAMPEYQATEVSSTVFADAHVDRVDSAHEATAVETAATQEASLQTDLQTATAPAAPDTVPLPGVKPTVLQPHTVATTGTPTPFRLLAEAATPWQASKPATEDGTTTLSAKPETMAQESEKDEPPVFAAALVNNPHPERVETVTTSQEAAPVELEDGLQMDSSTTVLEKTASDTLEAAAVPAPSLKPSILRLNDVAATGDPIPFHLLTDAATPWSAAPTATVPDTKKEVVAVADVESPAEAVDMHETPVINNIVAALPEVAVQTVEIATTAAQPDVMTDVTPAATTPPETDILVPDAFPQATSETPVAIAEPIPQPTLKPSMLNPVNMVSSEDRTAFRLVANAATSWPTSPAPKTADSEAAAETMAENEGQITPAEDTEKTVATLPAVAVQMVDVSMASIQPDVEIPQSTAVTEPTPEPHTKPTMLRLQDVVSGEERTAFHLIADATTPWPAIPAPTVAETKTEEVVVANTESPAEPSARHEMPVTNNIMVALPEVAVQTVEVTTAIRQADIMAEMIPSAATEPEMGISVPTALPDAASETPVAIAEPIPEPKNKPTMLRLQDVVAEREPLAFHLLAEATVPWPALPQIVAIAQPAETDMSETAEVVAEAPTPASATPPPALPKGTASYHDVKLRRKQAAHAMRALPELTEETPESAAEQNSLELDAEETLSTAEATPVATETALLADDLLESGDKATLETGLAGHETEALETNAYETPHLPDTEAEETSTAIEIASAPEVVTSHKPAVSDIAPVVPPVSEADTLVALTPLIAESEAEQPDTMPETAAEEASITTAATAEAGAADEAFITETSPVKAHVPTPDTDANTAGAETGGDIRQADAAPTQPVASETLPKLSASMRETLDALPGLYKAAPPTFTPPENIRIDRANPNSGLFIETLPEDDIGINLSMAQPTRSLQQKLEVGYRALMDNHIDAAVRMYQQILAEAPKQPDALFGLATSLHRGGELEAAQAVYRNLLEIDPYYPNALGNLLMLISSESPQETLQALEQLSQDNAESSPILAQLAYLQKRLGQPHKAIRAMVRAVKLSPENLLYRYNLAIMLDEVGEYQKAATLYQHIIDAYYEGLNIPGDFNSIQQRLQYIRSLNRR